MTNCNLLLKRIVEQTSDYADKRAILEHHTHDCKDHEHKSGPECEVINKKDHDAVAEVGSDIDADLHMFLKRCKI